MSGQGRTWKGLVSKGQSRRSPEAEEDPRCGGGRRGDGVRALDNGVQAPADTGQANRDGRSFAGCAGNPDTALMLLDDLLTVARPRPVPERFVVKNGLRRLYRHVQAGSALRCS